ncbi:MAG: single-stranded-DNA-specific exonuclease RecJ [Nitrospiraceae bacterium]|nr:single-stranded-DNA-specific exonuclease RecJ [Nitrospiraceae bacterium]
MDRIWILQRANKEYADYLSKAAGISNILARILINRQIKTPEAVKSFLETGANSLPDPFALKGVKEAVEIINRAKASGKPVLVHGDYDVDGISSTAIMVDALNRCGLQTGYFIPNRFEHGYGFHKEGVERALQMGAGLLVTTDCGITAFETAELAAKNGLEVIITDHHEPVRDAEGNPVTPRCGALINPKLTPGETELSGAGVAFKMAQALLGDDALTCLDLAALGTLADLVPLSEENRIIAKIGLELIGKSERAPLRALKELAGCSGKVGARAVCFALIPRLNAPGRIEDASCAVRFLLSSMEDEAVQAARELDRINKERQRLEEEVHVQAREALEREGFDGAIVASGEGWHKGVLGIVASRLSERHFRPSAVLSVEGAVAKGSARSIPQFDLYDGLNELKDMLLGFGGHRQAAGLRLEAAMVESFRKEFSSLVRQRVKEFRATLKIDAEVSLREVGPNLVQELTRLEPYGSGNPEPLLGAKRLQVLNLRVVGKGHLKMKLREEKGQKNFPVDAIGFNMGASINLIEECQAVDAVFTPVINEWEGGKSLQLNLKGLRPSAP